QANAAEERQVYRRNNEALTSNYLLTGLIRCERCGFAFQGQTQRVKGYVYPRYIDGGYQAKRVCTYIALPKDDVENFAFSSILETITNPKTLELVDTLITRLSTHKQTFADATLQAVNRELDAVERKKGNILETLSLAENEQTRRALMDKLGSLESEQTKLEIKISSLKSESRAERDFISLAHSVKNFMTKFESIYTNAPLYERKEIFKKCLQKIVVDREKNVVRVFVWVIPAVYGLPHLDMFKNKSALTSDELVSARSSGART
ncbi:MAG TPA: recombinase zinc beta ribbon domain-containing protein, partial [Bacteroidota bacterium]|nr:recombinase zinc beta ribbon domain-containing protein [Bacteroidota bacterium]